MRNTNTIKINAALFSLIAGFIIFLGKTVAFMLTDSTAVFSDAAESVVHILATLMVVFSIYLSNKPPDKSHFYGHGNIEYFSAGIEGLLIIIAALTIIYFSVIDLIYGANPKNLDLGSAIIGIAGIINLFVGFYLIKKGKATDSIALIADGKHILTDSFTSFGVIIGLVLILLTDIKILDPIIAIIVAVNIVFTGYNLIRNSIGELMNETDEKTLKEIFDILKTVRRSYWIDIHELRFWKSAQRIFLDFHIILPHYFTIRQSHMEEEYILEQLKSIKSDIDIRIHIDNCNSHLCKYCKYFECNVRESEFIEQHPFTVDKLVGKPIVSD